MRSIVFAIAMSLLLAAPACADELVESRRIATFEFYSNGGDIIFGSWFQLQWNAGYVELYLGDWSIRFASEEKPVEI